MVLLSEKLVIFTRYIRTRVCARERADINLMAPNRTK